MRAVNLNEGPSLKEKNIPWNAGCFLKGFSSSNFHDSCLNINQSHRFSRTYTSIFMHCITWIAILHSCNIDSDFKRSLSIGKPGKNRKTKKKCGPKHSQLPFSCSTYLDGWQSSQKKKWNSESFPPAREKTIVLHLQNIQQFPTECVGGVRNIGPGEGRLSLDLLFDCIFWQILKCCIQHCPPDFFFTGEREFHASDIKRDLFKTPIFVSKFPLLTIGKVTWYYSQSWGLFGRLPKEKSAGSLEQPFMNPLFLGGSGLQLWLS